MKTLIYIPFLLVVAIIYTRFAEDSLNKAQRAPASMSEEVNEEKDCFNLPKKMNPHFNSDECFN